MASSKMDGKIHLCLQVNSTAANPAAVVSGWASWAVGAIGAKFYKSSNPPPTQQSSNSSPDKRTPDRDVLRPTPAPATTGGGSSSSGPLKLTSHKPEPDSGDLMGNGDGWGGDDDDGDAWESFEEGKSSFTILCVKTIQLYCLHFAERKLCLVFLYIHT